VSELIYYIYITILISSAVFLFATIYFIIIEDHALTIASSFAICISGNK